MTGQPPVVVVVRAQKNVGVAIILAILFGPLGLLYASVTGGMLMFVLSVVVAIATMGVGLLLTWLLCIPWAYIAATGYNARLDAEPGGASSPDVSRPAS